MAILTISVFASAQFSGPESALQLYHVAVLNNDGDRLSAVVLQDPESGSARELLAHVSNLMRVSEGLRVVSIERKGRNAIVTMSYISQFGQAFVPFYMVKPLAKWQIDTELTITLLQSM